MELNLLCCDYVSSDGIEMNQNGLKSKKYCENLACANINAIEQQTLPDQKIV
jgi:hypothetical protein